MLHLFNIIPTALWGVKRTRTPFVRLYPHIKHDKIHATQNEADALLQKLSIRLSGTFLLGLQAWLFQLIWTPETGSMEIYLTYTILTVLAVLAAIAFFFLQQAGWLLAMMTQGVSLLITLFVYFFGNAIVLAQITMAYSIFMVLYFNLHIIRSAFYTGENNRVNGEVYE